jgi:hypothetical protein
MHGELTGEWSERLGVHGERIGKVVDHLIIVHRAETISTAKAGT